MNGSQSSRTGVALKYATTSAVAAKVKTALTAYFDGRLLGQNVLLAKLGSVIYSVEGVKNYVFSAPAADVAVTGAQLPVLGAITVTEA